MISSVKEGFVQRYKAAFSSGWESNYAVLYSNSTLSFFKNKVNITTIADIKFKCQLVLRAETEKGWNASLSLTVSIRFFISVKLRLE